MAESNYDRHGIESVQSTVDSNTEETTDKTIEKTHERSSPTFDFKEKSWMTDFILVVEGIKFHVAKNILALASPVFKRMFESDFKEKACDELEMVGKRAEDVNEFLLEVYPSAAPVLCKENALKVLPLADEYQVLVLKQKCEDALLESTDTFTKIDELYRLIRLAHRYELRTLHAKSVSLVSERSVEDIQRENINIALPAESLRDVFQKVLKRMNELELSDFQKAKELETCKTWTNILSKTLKKADVPTFDEDLDWMGKTLIVTMDMIRKKPVTEIVAMFGTELHIGLQISVLLDYAGEFVWASITNVTIKTECQFKLQSVVLNKLPTEEHLSLLHTVAFSSKRQNVQCNIAKTSQIADPKKGFVYEGKVQIQLNIMMSKPKKAA